MEHILINEEISRLLKTNHHFEWNQIFIKGIPKEVTKPVYFDTINLMDKNRDKLKEEYYAFVNRIYYDSLGERVAIGSDYCREYQTFYEFFVNENKASKDGIIMGILDAVMGLDVLGIDYWDLHSFNILVNKEKHIKLVDLDGAKVRKVDEKERLNGIIELILESYFFFDMKRSTSASTNSFADELRSLISLRKYYPPEFVRLIEGTYRELSIVEDIEMVLKELEDKEKIMEIRDKVKRIRPYWFNE